MFHADVGVIGGCGRVGLPLSIAFADRGLSVVIYDLNNSRMEQVRSGKMPFLEVDLPQKFKPFQLRHRHIGNQQVDVVTIPEKVHRLPSILSYLHLKALIYKNISNDNTYIRVIINDEDS